MSEVEFLIEVAYPVAQAAYTAMNIPTPPLSLPAGYALVGTIDANPQQAAELTRQATPDQQMLVNHMITQSAVFGVVVFNAAETTAIVAIRGTQTPKDWLDDLDALPQPFAPYPAAGLVHMGFLIVYEHVRASIHALLGQCAGVRRVVVTGHSLGGAVAILCAFDVLKNFNLDLVPEVHSFAGPRTGDPHFAGAFNEAIPICNRVVNFLDVVPQLPFPPFYEHVGREILVHGGFRPFDITYAHHLTTYLAGLHKLPGAPAAPFAAALARTGQNAAAAATVAGAQAVVAAAQAGAAAVMALAAEAETRRADVVVEGHAVDVR